MIYLKKMGGNMLTAEKVIKLMLPAAMRFRKIYSAVLFFFLWHLSFKHSLHRWHNVNGHSMLHPNTMELLGHDQFKSIVRNMTWVSEKRGGLIDFTYGNLELMLVPGVYKEWGRDCDDFANLCWQYMKTHKWDEAYIILVTTGKFKYMFSKSHMIAIGKRDKRHTYEIFDNNFITATTLKTLDDIMVNYAGERKGRGTEYEPCVWGIYRKNTNRKD
jgi:hypothetical protein